MGLYNGSSGTVQLLADVVGYYRGGTATDAGAFTAITPTRVLDTRIGTGAPPVRLSAERHGDLRGRRARRRTGIERLGRGRQRHRRHARRRPGYLTTYAGGGTRPAASTLNYAPGQTRANLVTVKVGAAGGLSVYNGSTGPVNVLVDVAGYYLGGTPTEPGTFVALDPTPAARHPDSGPAQHRPDQARLGPPRGWHHQRGASALVVNGTVTQPTRSGFLAFQGATEF